MENGWFSRCPEGESNLMNRSAMLGNELKGLQALLRAFKSSSATERASFLLLTEHFRDSSYCRSPHSLPQEDTALPFLLNINNG